MSTTPKPPPRAYSYLRFSTLEQQKGDSLRRQSSMAVDYAQRNGLELDQELTFQDIGVAAYRGQNVESGRLAYFLEAVRSGLVPRGSILLVEQLDRLSRLTPRKAIRVLEDIVDEDITVVTLNDGKAYTAASLDESKTDLIIAVLTFMRANEESDTKSRRLKQAWEAKRANIHAKPLTSRAPAWLTLDTDAGAFRPVPDRVRTLRRIFELAAEGVGQNSIAQRLNEEGLAPWGRGKHWHRSYIAKLLSSEAAIGTFRPQTLEYEGNKKVRKPLEPVPNYFPAAIPDDLWQDVQALQDTERAPSRGRHAHKPITNILASLACCPLCGGTMTRVNKGAKSRPALVCAAAKVGAGCEYRSVRYDAVEEAIIQHLPARLRDTPSGSGFTEIDEELERLEAEAEALPEMIEAAVDRVLRTNSSAVSDRLRDLELRWDAVMERREVLRRQRAAKSGPLIANRVERLLEALKRPSDAGTINAAMRAVFSRATVNYSDGLIELEWTHGGTCDLPFALPSNLPPA